MSNFSLTVLGANSAIPIQGRFSSAFVLEHHSASILIDCGEGAQIKMSEFGVKRSKISHIFISHLHGDHIFGLPGFLTSLILNGRTETLTIVGPVGIRSFIEHLPYVLGDHVTFEIRFVELEEEKVHDIEINDHLRAKAFPLRHRIPTFGYRFDELPEAGYNIKSAAIEKYHLTIPEIKQIKAQGTLPRDPSIPSSELVMPSKEPRSFAYCSDTIYHPDIVPIIESVHLLYHEATYTKEYADKARQYYHSTAQEAGQIASQANAKKLLIGHYSSRYKDLTPLLQEAKEEFDHVLMATEGVIVPID